MCVFVCVLFVGLAPADRPTHPNQKNLPLAKSEIHQRGRKYEADFRYTNVFLASDPPPDLGFSLSNSLT